MAPLTQVFVRTLDGRTRCLNFERDDASHEDALTLRHLRRALESSEGVPASEQLIRVGGLVLVLSRGAGCRRQLPLWWVNASPWHIPSP